MEVRLVTIDQFYALFPTVRSVYGSRDFIELNAYKAEAVRCFVGYDEKDKPRLGLVMGFKDGEWRAPFSAPFAEIAYREPQSIERIYDFISDLADLLEDHSVTVTLAPTFYDPELLTRAYGILANFVHKTYWDFNYHYDLAAFPDFVQRLDRSARKNFHRAQEQGFEIALTDDVARAYAVIAANRKSHGYPLAMSLEQVMATVESAVKADFFVLSHGSADVAAAMVYHVAEGIAQVVYWGDAPGYSEMRPMNYLSWYVFDYYYRGGYRIVDVGPSSSKGVPSSGLCRFKQSIACTLTLKPTFIL